MLFSLLYFLVLRLLGAGGRLQDEKDIELLVLRHQVKVLQRQMKRPRLNRLDRVLLAYRIYRCTRMASSGDGGRDHRPGFGSAPSRESSRKSAETFSPDGDHLLGLEGESDFNTVPVWWSRVLSPRRHGASASAAFRGHQRRCAGRRRFESGAHPPESHLAGEPIES